MPLFPLEERTVDGVPGVTVRELTIGQVMDLREQHPDGGMPLSLAMLAAAVHGPDGQPIGPEGARALTPRMVVKLTPIVAELTGQGAAEEDAPKNE